MTSVGERPSHFEWRQDSRRRVLKLSGTVDGSSADRLSSGIIDLGARRLVIDITEVTSMDEAGASSLRDLTHRLGDGRVTVVPDPSHQFGPGDI
ncbi:MAG TPA: STAS domain-containing protein [Acidimicrobiia bacterium]|nr:STAS domain-containing protein [Acidimicrobiia bacterium]